MAILMGWSQVIVPLWFPPAEKPAEVAGNEPGNTDEEAPANALFPANGPAPELANVPNNAQAADAMAPVDGAAPVAAAGHPNHPLVSVPLGSTDPSSPYFMAVELNSRGATVDRIELNDPRYPAFGRRGELLTVVGDDSLALVKTFALRSEEIDRQLKKTGFLDTINWEVVPGSQSENTVDFRIVAPDGSVEITKHYEVRKLTEEQRNTPRIRDTFSPGYDLILTVSVKNLSQAATKVSYLLQGPVGVPLEDPDNSSKWRDVRMGFINEDGTVDPRHMRTREVVNEQLNEKPEVWRRPLKYIGVDNKYFAALIHPTGDQLKTPSILWAQPIVVSENRRKPDHSDVSVVINSPEMTLGAGEIASQTFEMFAGPKKKELLSALSATSIVFDSEGSGFFLFLWNLFQVETISEFMLWLLKTFHSLGMGYGLAIIMLTAVVRGAMFPLSKKQVANMEKMKKLQPELQALQKKYAQQPEQFVSAQRELFRKHEYHPAQGCLPVLVQMPIFIGLYWALNTSLDLRMARFLWIDSLASPDALFNLGFTVPFLEWTQFNLLPLLTICLFVVQQKLTMPPPTTDEQAMQYKVMNFMMIFMGAMFYRVPAGLCLYFIASSLWGLIERWLLSRHKAALAAADTGVIETTATRIDDSKNPNRAPEPAKPKTGFAAIWGQLQDAADRERGSGSGTVRNSPPNGNGKPANRKPPKKR